MGYYVDGGITIRGSAQHDTMCALGMDVLYKRLDEYSPGSGESVHRQMPASEQDIVSRLLFAVGFEVYSVTEEDGYLVRSASHVDKWWSVTDQVLEFLAEQGYEINGKFRGEDGTEWAVIAELDSQNFREVGLESVNDTELKHLRACEYTIGLLQSVVADTNLDDAEFRRQVTAALANADI